MENPWTDSKRATLNNMATEIHKNAVAHGWWDDERGFPEIVALIHSELSEALEEYRDGKPMVYHVCGNTDEKTRYLCEADTVSRYCGVLDVTDCEYYDSKPSGLAIELADAMIRILDYCAHEGIDIETAIRIKHEYNKTRPYRHGGKRC